MAGENTMFYCSVVMFLDFITFGRDAILAGDECGEVGNHPIEAFNGVVGKESHCDELSMAILKGEHLP